MMTGAWQWWAWLGGGAVVARPPLEQVDWDRVTWRHVRTE